ncbi:MAG: insulinase family protein [Armatimonadetes bacterium]|nr:insulinase family protein [Armatimonadota bacterium]
MKLVPLFCFAVLTPTVAASGAHRAFAQDAAPPVAPPPSTVVRNLSPIDLQPLEVAIPPAKEFTLPNGGHIFIVEDARTPLVTFSISVRAGELMETNAGRGVASLAALCLREGTKTYSAEKIAELEDKYGASFNASAGDERVTATLSCLIENADELLPVLAELVYAPTFPAQRVKQVQTRLVANAVARQNDPNRQAAEALNKAMYGETSVFGRPAPTPEQIGAVAPEQVTAFHARFYRPDSALIGVAGNVKADTTGSVLLREFGSQRNPDAPAPVLPAAVFVAQGTSDGSAAPVPIVVNRPGSAQTVLSFGVPGINRRDPEYFPLLLANRILGGGFNSRLNQKLREEKGYTYGARSTVNAPKWTGTWTASASVRNAVTANAATDFLNEFVRLQTVPPKAGELDLIKQALIGSFALTLESPGAVLSRSIERYEYGLPADYWNTYAARVRAVTPEDVVRVARQYLGSGNAKTASAKVWSVAVGEAAQIETGFRMAVAPDAEAGKTVKPPVVTPVPNAGER